MTPVQKWFEQMRSIWIEKRPNDIGVLLSDNAFNYHEHPFSASLKTKNEVTGAWQEILNQDIDYVEVKILYETESVGCAEWRFKIKNEPLHIGSYFLKLDSDGKCIEFRQWWTVE